jgi:hypothetical protein
MLTGDSKNIKVENITKISTDICCLFNGHYIKVPKNSYISIVGFRFNYCKKNTDIRNLISGTYEGKPMIKVIPVINAKNSKTAEYTQSDLQCFRKMIIELIDMYSGINILNLSRILKTIDSLNKGLKKNILPEIKQDSPDTETKQLSKGIGFDVSKINDISTIQNIYNMGYFDIYTKLSYSKDVIQELKSTLAHESEKHHRKAEKYKKQMEFYIKENIAFTRFGKKMDALTDKEIKLLHEEYQRLSKIKKIDKEMYEDVYAFIKMVDVYDSGIKDELKRIKKEYKKTDNHYFKDKTPVLCAHTVDKAEYIVKNNISSASVGLRNHMLDNFSYIQEGNYYCKFCGEFLYEGIEEEASSATALDYNDIRDTNPIYEVVYRETQYLIHTFVNGKNITNMAPIISNIANVIKPEIYSKEAEMLRIKTADKFNVNMTLKIYICIYVFASITQLIYTNKEDIHLIAGGDGFTKKSKVDIQKLLNKSLYLIKKIKKKEIENSDFINMDNIKPIFLNAFRWILSLDLVSHVRVEQPYFLDDELINYIIFGFNMGAKKALPVNKTYDMPFNDYSDTTKILGRNLDSLLKDIKSKSIYETAIVPEWDNKYKSDSLKMTIEYAKDNFLKLPSQLDDFYKKYEYLKQTEGEKTYRDQISKLNPIFRMPDISDLDDHEPICGCQKQLIFLIDGKKKEVELSQVAKWLEEKNPIYKKMKLAEERCSCKKENKNYVDLEAFYHYYEYICPTGNLHEMKKGKCAKCGMTNDILLSRDIPYYNKYIKKYRESRQHEKDELNKNLNKKRTSFKKDIQKDGNKNNKKNSKKGKSEWKYSNTLILEMLRLMDITENIFYGLGLGEGQEYENIKKGKINFEDISDGIRIKQIMTLRDYCLFFIRTYNNVKTSESMVTYPKIIKELLETHSNKNIFKILNDDFSDFISTYESIEKETPLTIVNFIQNYMSKILLSIHNSLKSHDIKFAKDFTHLLIDTIISYEKKTTNFIVKNTRYNDGEIDLNAKTERVQEFDENRLEGETAEMESELEYTEEIIDDEQEMFNLRELDIDIEDDEDHNLYKAEN